MRKQEIQNKKIVRLVTALSSVLFLMCSTMAVSLIQYRERLAKIESQLNNVGSNYSDILSRLEEENLQIVFAEENIEDIEVPIAEEVNKTSETEDLIIISEELEEDEENTSNVDNENIEDNKENVSTKETAEGDEVDLYTVKKEIA